MKSIHTVPSYFFEIHFNIFLSAPRSSKWFFYLLAHLLKLVCISLLSLVYYMLFLSHSPWFHNDTNDICCVQILKLLVMYLSSIQLPPTWWIPVTSSLPCCQVRGKKESAWRLVCVSVHVCWHVCVIVRTVSPCTSDEQPTANLALQNEVCKNHWVRKSCSYWDVLEATVASIFMVEE